MTQFNAGKPSPCKTCDSARERQYHAESNRLRAEEQAEAERRKQVAIARITRNNTPEAMAKRAVDKQTKLQNRRDQHKKVVESVTDAMSTFSRFF